MCGITGMLHFDAQRPIEKSRLKQMSDIIRHRGPDGEGFFVEGNVGLGHRRLSIIDLQTGDQPMFSDDKQKILVFNGEIYNSVFIRRLYKGKAASLCVYENTIISGSEKSYIKTFDYNTHIDNEMI